MIANMLLPPQLLVPPASPPLAAATPPLRWPLLHSWSVADYERMIADGLLDENQKLELIEGRLVEKMPIGDLHIGCVNRSSRLLMKRLDDRCTVQVQSPVKLADSLPEPDLCLLRFREDGYSFAKAVVADILLLVEVAETSFEFDRDVKGPIYATAGVPEYWLIDLNQGQILVYRQPDPAAGRYAEMKTHRRGDPLACLAFPEVQFQADDLMPPVE